MIGKKNLSEVKAEVAALLATLSGRSPRQWLDREIEAAKGQRERDVETLQMLRAALERSVRKGRKRGPGRTAAKR